MIYRVLGLTSLLLLGAVVALTRRRLLRERHATLWVGLSLMILILSVWPYLINKLGYWLGVAYPPTVFLVGGVLVTLVLTLRLTVTVAVLEGKLIRLTEEQAILSSLLAKSLANTGTDSIVTESGKAESSAL